MVPRSSPASSRKRASENESAYFEVYRGFAEPGTTNEPRFELQANELMDGVDRFPR